MNKRIDQEILEYVRRGGLRNLRPSNLHATVSNRGTRVEIRKKIFNDKQRRFLNFLMDVHPPLFEKYSDTLSKKLQNLINLK